MNEAEDGPQGWDDSEHLVHPHLLPLSTLELPIAGCLLTASLGKRMEVGLRAGGKRGAGTVLDVWGSREDSWTRAFKKRILSQDRKIEIDSTRMSFLTSVQEQAKDMVWFSDALSVPERMSCTCLLTSGKTNGDPDCEASASVLTPSCLEGISQEAKARMEEEAYNKG